MLSLEPSLQNWDGNHAWPNNFLPNTRTGYYLVRIVGRRKSMLLISDLNINVEFGAVIAELGRQPRMAKQFFTKYQDRILFGKDSWAPEEYATYFRSEYKC